MRRILGVVLIPALLWAGCAKQAPPSGGPVDDIAPELVGVYPDSFAVGVPRDTTLHIQFTERIDSDALDRALWVLPEEVVIKDIYRDDLTLGVKFRNPLPEDAVVSVLVGTHLADRRGNRLLDPVHWVFTTGDSLPPGEIRGVVSGKPERSRDSRSRGGEERTMIAVFAAADTAALEDRSVLALTEADRQGGFLLPGLRADWGEVVVVPFLDENGNNQVDSRDEYWSAKRNRVTLSPEDFSIEIRAALVSPTAPGVLAGFLRRAEGDSSALGLELYEAEDDSLSAAVASGRLRPEGDYLLPGVPPGGYRLVAYCDANENDFRDVLEAWMVWEDTLRVFPGDTTRVDTIQAMDCTQEGNE